MRMTVAVAAVSLLIVGASGASDAGAAIRKLVNIPAEGLGPALQTLAKDRGFQVIYLSDLVETLQTQGATGDFTEEEALKHLLAGTGLTYRYLDEKTVTVFPMNGSGGDKKQGPTGEYPSSNGDERAANANQEGKKSSSQQFRLAQTNQGSAQSPSTVGVAEQSSQTSQSNAIPVTEIIVTAQKREERLQDVPVPVTAISSEALVNSGQVQIQEYSTRIPGLNVTPDDYGAPQLTIRGLSSQGATPTVGIVVDDVPFGSSTATASGAEVPDIDPNDLARVEVLRGPQGTLYGASSLGGLLKFVTLDPSTDAFSGHVQAGTSSVYNGAELGYNFRASANVPLSDTLAIRASGFTREDPGYVDNPVLGIDGINESRTSGGRLATLWRPNDGLSLKLSAAYQQQKTDGLNDVLPELGYLKQDYLPGLGAHESTSQAYSAMLTAKVGTATLTSVSGYTVNNFRGSIDLTSVYGQAVINPLFGVPGTEVINNPKTSKFTQEVRLSIPIGDRIDWLVGGYYDHESSPSSESILAVDPGTGATVGTFESISYPSVYSEYAGFTDLTVRISDRFDVQIGGRESENKQSYQQTAYFGPEPIGSAPASTVVTPKQYTTGNAFTYLVTPRFKISPDLMVYARFASGYRPGGPNYNVQGGLPPSYSPDKTLNYEVGFKGAIFDRLLTIDTSLYYIDWKNIQIALVQPVTEQGYFANAGSAKSQGIEISLESKPLSGMTIAAWVAFNDAVLTENFPAGSTAAGGAYGVSGDRLPNTSRVSGNISLDQEFTITSRIRGFAGASVSYVGNSLSVFQPTAQRQEFPSYARTDLRGGARYDSWLINLYANNVVNRRAIVGGGLGYFNPADFQYIQPRTLGLSVDRKF